MERIDFKLNDEDSHTLHVFVDVASQDLVDDVVNALFVQQKWQKLV